MERNDIEASINAAYAEKNSETSRMKMYALNKILLVEDDIHISEVIHDLRCVVRCAGTVWFQYYF